MAGVVSSVASTKETTNYARLCRLLVDIGSQALRDTFDGIHAPATLHRVLASHPVHSTLQALFKGKKKILNPAQWGKLYPAIPSSVSSANFDITLLMVLLRNICGLTPPATGWDALPPEADKSREADIARLKYFRNTVYGHAEQASVDDVTFNRHWQNIRTVLVRLWGAKYGDEIDTLKTECMDPDVEEHYKELLQQWKKDEYIIKDQLQEMGNDIKYIKEALRMAIDKPKSENVSPNKMQPYKSIHRRGEIPDISGHKSNNVDENKNFSEGQVENTLFPGQTKETYHGRSDKQPSNVKRSGGVPSDYQNSSRPPNHSVASKERKHVALDSDDSSTGSAVRKRCPPVGARTEYKMPSGNTGGHRMDSATTISHSLSQHKTVTPLRSSHQYFRSKWHRKFVSDDPWRATQSGTMGSIAYRNGYQSKMSARTESQLPGLSSGDAMYVNPRDINNFAARHFESTKVDEPTSTKLSVRGRDDGDAGYGQTVPRTGSLYDTDQHNFFKWSCVCCTFLNPPDRKICAMCCKTRLDDAVELVPVCNTALDVDTSGASKTGFSSTDNTQITNADIGPAGDAKKWSCVCCTFLNPSFSKICAVCNRTRADDAVELAPARINFCRNCTFHNKDDAKVCVACHRSLNFGNPETSV